MLTAIKILVLPQYHGVELLTTGCRDIGEQVAAPAETGSLFPDVCCGLSSNFRFMLPLLAASRMLMLASADRCDFFFFLNEKGGKKLEEGQFLLTLPLLN